MWELNRLNTVCSHFIRLQSFSLSFNQSGQAAKVSVGKSYFLPFTERRCPKNSLFSWNRKVVCKKFTFVCDGIKPWHTNKDMMQFNLSSAIQYCHLSSIMLTTTIIWDALFQHVLLLNYMCTVLMQRIIRCRPLFSIHQFILANYISLSLSHRVLTFSPCLVCSSSSGTQRTAGPLLSLITTGGFGLIQKNTEWTQTKKAGFSPIGQKANGTKQRVFGQRNLKHSLCLLQIGQIS